MKKTLSIVILSIALTSVIFVAWYMINVESPDEITYVDIGADEATQLLINSQDVTILDVRTRAEYESGHIAGAISIPLSELEGKIDELDRDETIIVYCKSGVRSENASNVLVIHGFKNAYNMLGGINAWIDAGFPVISSSSMDQQGQGCLCQGGDNNRMSLASDVRESNDPCWPPSEPPGCCTCLGQPNVCASAQSQSTCNAYCQVYFGTTGTYSDSTWCCWTKCVDISSDDENCGRCGRDCTPTGRTCKNCECVCPEGTIFCEDRKCHECCTHPDCGANAHCYEYTCYCNAGYGNCDEDWSNGCEVKLDTDNNCGSCSNVCPEGEHCECQDSSCTCVPDVPEFPFGHSLALGIGILIFIVFRRKFVHPKVNH